jgi:hypothetical protein
VLFRGGANVTYWHKADLLALPPDVGFREKSRRARYVGRCPHVAPERTSKLGI